MWKCLKFLLHHNLNTDFVHFLSIAPFFPSISSLWKSFIRQKRYMSAQKTHTHTTRIACSERHAIILNHLLIVHYYMHKVAPTIDNVCIEYIRTLSPCFNLYINCRLERRAHTAQRHQLTHISIVVYVNAKLNWMAERDKSDAYT